MEIEIKKELEKINVCDVPVGEVFEFNNQLFLKLGNQWIIPDAVPNPCFNFTLNLTQQFAMGDTKVLLKKAKLVTC